MDWGRVQFFFSEVWRNFTRNLIMQFTAIGTVTVTIVLLGAFLFTRATIGAIGDDVLKKIEISVFLRDNVSAADAHKLAVEIGDDARVQNVVYVPKAEGLRQMRERLRGQIDTSLLTTNPLPDALRVQVQDPNQVIAVAETIRKKTNVASVEYAADAVQKLLRISDVLGRIGLGIVCLLVFTAAIIISNTIRLTVFARRREIAIMQLVGASTSYVRFPFHLRGILDGVLGSALALVLLEVARYQLLPKLTVALPFVPMRAAGHDQLLFALELLGTGAAVGIVASWISVGTVLARLKRIAGALIAGLVCTSAVLPCATGAAALHDRMSQQQAQIKETRSRLAQKRQELQFQERRSSDLRDQLSETNDSIARVSATLDELQGQVASNQRKLSWNQVQLTAAEATLERHNEALKRRLVDAYERGDLGYVNVLLSATSFSDFVERWDDIRYLIAANQNTVRERRAAERAVTAARRGLEGEQLVLDDSLARQQRAKFQLASLATQRQQLYAVADLERRNVAHDVATLEELSASEEAAFEEMIRERQREEAARIAAEQEQRRRAAQLAGQTLPVETAPGAPGAMSWPVSGPITSPFGMRINAMTGQGMEMHPGIDIGAPMGATVTAAAGGRIIWAKPYGGYGNAIIIDHGGNTSSVYGHLSQIFVAEGQDVQRGQAIGAVGCTGRCTGPHLHFEVRVNGNAVDPTGLLH